MLFGTIGHAFGTIGQVNLTFHTYLWFLFSRFKKYNQTVQWIMK